MHLFLIPTAMELARLQSDSPSWFEWARTRGEVRLCGFGPIAAAARTSQLISQLAPNDVCLLGIAGLYPLPETPATQTSAASGSQSRPCLNVGDASSFDSVACHGIGVGTGAAHVDAEQLGWMQWSGDAENDPASAPAFGNRIDLPSLTPSIQQQLLTCCSCSADPREASQRAALHPSAIAEDMEGYGVAMACRLHAKSLLIIRGISNIAGCRDKSQWRVGDAMLSAAKLAIDLLH